MPAKLPTFLGIAGIFWDCLELPQIHQIFTEFSSFFQQFLKKLGDVRIYLK
jgi:hypothetical protein